MMSATAHTDLAWFKKNLENTALVSSLKKITLIIMDVDGTLTDGTISFSQTEELGRNFSIIDGYAFRPAAAAGIKIALLSGKNNKSTYTRGKDLGIPPELCIIGRTDKNVVIKELQTTYGCTPENTLVVGDDVPDALVKQGGVAALYACPANTSFYLQPLADIVLPRDGGNHAIRLLLDFVLYAQGKHFAAGLVKKTLESFETPCGLLRTSGYEK